MNHEIYCSNETQDVADVTLVPQDPSGDINKPSLSPSRQRLDNLGLGDKATSGKNLAQGSTDISFDDEPISDMKI